MKKRLISILLVIIMIISGIPSTCIKTKAASDKGVIAKFTFDNYGSGFRGDEARAYRMGSGCTLSSDAVSGNSL